MTVLDPINPYSTRPVPELTPVHEAYELSLSQEPVTHLVKCAVALVPHPVAKVKKVMFVYILELLNEGGHEAFFELQKGGRKANNAQKEKRRLARKRSRAAKREREREAAKAAQLPPRERQCVACGRKFNSRKTARKHKCPRSKVVRIPEKAAEKQVSHPPLPANLDKPRPLPTPIAPTAPPSNSYALPVVTGGSQDSIPFANRRVAINQQTGERRIPLNEEEWHKLRTTGPWELASL